VFFNLGSAHSSLGSETFHVASECNTAIYFCWCLIQAFAQPVQLFWPLVTFSVASYNSLIDSDLQLFIETEQDRTRLTFIQYSSCLSKKAAQISWWNQPLVSSCYITCTLACCCSFLKANSKNLRTGILKLWCAKKRIDGWSTKKALLWISFHLLQNKQDKQTRD